MSGSVPSGAVGLSVVVLLYSIICLFLSCLLFFLLWRQNSRWTYVSYVALFCSIQTLASLIQQIHYAADFKAIKIAQAAVRNDSLSQPSAVVGGASTGIDLILFWIQYYGYNVNALLILFWSIQLFKNTWRLRSKSVWLTETAIERSCKAFAIIFPGFVLGIAQIGVISSRYVPYLFLCNIILFVSLLGGSTFLALTLWRFVQARRRVNASSDHSSAGVSHSATITGKQSDNRNLNPKVSSDRWLVIRFTIAFIILSIFEVCVILFEVVSYFRNTKATASDEIDLSTGSAQAEIAQFIPGVTASLVAFLIWGTTSPFRAQMRKMFCCGGRDARRVSNPHTRGGSVAAKLRAHTISNFERLEESSEDGSQHGMKHNDIQVTTELSVFREDSRPEVLPTHAIGTEAWHNHKLQTRATVVEIPPARSKSVLSLNRSESTTRRP